MKFGFDKFAKCSIRARKKVEMKNMQRDEDSNIKNVEEQEK